MIRTFHPVGQGTFITEQFDNGQNTVFDCGSATSRGLISDLIKSAFQKGEVVNCVFISSVDTEHANGLEALLKWCRVEKLVIPFLHEDEKALSLLKHLCEGGKPDDFLARLIKNPKRICDTHRPDMQGLSFLTMVVEDTKKEHNLFDVALPVALVPVRAVSGFRMYLDEHMDWIYQPASYRQEDRIRRLKAKIAEQGLAPSDFCTVQQVLKAWKDPELREKLQTAFDSLGETFCAVSMAVYAGSEQEEFPVYEQCPEQGKWKHYAKIHAACMYIGNLHLTRNYSGGCLDKIFGSHLPKVGCWLLPGHGSSSLYDEKVLTGKDCVVVAMADNENCTGEPHTAVIKDVLKHRIPFYLVTELPGSTVRFFVKERAAE